ncbi:MAG: ATP-binding cassette domain-containing protein [Candidatus Mycalebacterium zealandia]|nr:MAG: ATP-binding cassette domain-containing protein [Candidatus Mycalebacterium zealandia]
MNGNRGEKNIFTTLRDRKMLSWLAGFIRRRGGFLAAAFILMTCTAALEIAVPYIARHAVDNHISLLWQKNSAGKIVEIASSAPPSRGGKTKRYLVVDTSNPSSKSSKIVERNPELFELARGTAHISEKNLLLLSDGEIKTLRATDMDGIVRLAVIMMLCVVGIFSMSSLSNYLLKVSGEHIIRDIRERTFRRIMSLPQKFFDENPTGRITTRVTNDLNSISDMYSSVVVQVLKDLFLFVGVAVVMFSLDSELALTMIFIVGGTAFVAHFFRRRLRFSHRRIRRSIARLNSFVQESVRGIRIIKDYGREDQNFGRFRETNKENFLANMEQLWVFEVFRPFIEYAAVAAIGIIIWHGGTGVIDGKFTAGTLIAFIYYTRMMFRPVLEVSEKYNILQSAIAATENLYDINEVDPERAGELSSSERGGEMEFQNVWFSYGGGKWVLKNVSFKMSAGEWVAIVGLTGSGKSTMFNLMFRLYEPQRGKILFNGIDTSHADLKWLRSRIAPVFQERKYYEKKDDSRGGALSSGEEQIKNIDEVLAGEPAIVIMDEATSNMDARTEKDSVRKVRDLSLKRGFSLITIAHRLSSVREADRIMVVHNGEIVETGTHSELSAMRGVYNSLDKFASG